MITADELVAYRTSSDDYELTERLKARLAQQREKRHPFYLTAKEFDEILHWKLRGQYGRQREWRKINTGEVIRVVTTAAFNITHPDDEYETELRIGILCTLTGC